MPILVQYRPDSGPLAHGNQGYALIILRRWRNLQVVRRRVWDGRRGWGAACLPDPAITDYLPLPENAPLTRVPRYANKD